MEMAHLSVALCLITLLSSTRNGGAYVEARVGGTMNTAVCKDLNDGSWKDLYQSALFETDLSKLAERIAAAEAALIVRSRELFYTTVDDGEEGEKLDYAMCALHALRVSLNRHPTVEQKSMILPTLKQA